MILRLVVTGVLFTATCIGVATQGFAADVPEQYVRRSYVPWITAIRNERPGRWITAMRNDPPGQNIKDGFGRRLRFSDYPPGPRW